MHFNRHVKLCHRPYPQVEEPILWTVKLLRLYTIDGTAKALESAERIEGMMKSIQIIRIRHQAFVRGTSSSLCLLPIALSVALCDSESGSHLRYPTKSAKNIYFKYISKNKKNTCVKIESHIRNCIPQHRLFHLFRHSILLLCNRKIIIANRATLFKWSEWWSEVKWI